MTTRTAFDSRTERIAYVLSGVHNTASSSAPPLIVRLRFRSLVDEVGVKLETYLIGLELEFSMSLQRSEGSSISLKLPASLQYVGENRSCSPMMTTTRE